MASVSSVSSVALNWLHILEKEFDLGFVDTDTCLAHVFAIASDTEDAVNCQQFNELMVNICDARQHLTQLSSVFTQLLHKTITMANHNIEIMKELDDLKREVCQLRADKKLTENDENLRTETKSSDSYHSKNSHPNERNSFDMLRVNPMGDGNELVKQKSRQLEVKNQECDQLSKENNYLRRQTLQLQSELFGSRLAAKYLDKELAGRIQQLQLLGRDVKDADHERLWSQLEAEIHLHRHKTVIRACRASCQSPRPLPAPLEPSNGEMRRRQGVGNVRFVTVDKDGAEGLGISITGGKEHGVPIIISQIHDNTAAARSQALYVGDAVLSVNSIDLRNAKHTEAAHILANQSGKCVLEVLFVAPDDHTDDEDDVGCAHDHHSGNGSPISRTNYPFYDSQVIDSKAEPTDHYCDTNSQAIHECESLSLDDSASQANGESTLSANSGSSSPTKRYPGVARLSLRTSHSSPATNITNCDTNSRIETLIE